KESGEGGLLGGFHRAGDSEFEGALDAGLVVGMLFMEEAGGEGAGGLNEGGVVQEGKSLLRSVGYDAIGGAFVAIGSIEVRKHGMQEGALPMHVDASAPLAVIGVSHVGSARELEILVVVS